MVRNQEFDYLETHPQPKENDLAKYYESEEYISHTDSKKGLMAFLYQTIKKRSLKKKERLIRSLHNGVGTVLDIGAGTGDFLKITKDKGWKIGGVEVNEKAREIALEKNVILKDTMDAFEGQQFDVVTLWHVLEHLPDLHSTIAKIEKLVKNDGTLIIAVPNYNSYDARHYGKFWAAYDAPRHLWHFSKTSMERIFSSMFELKKTLPMIFDSYYVALLSEKYKSGASFSIKAVWLGWRSNIKALRTKESSSLIYCYRKTN